MAGLGEWFRSFGADAKVLVNARDGWGWSSIFVNTFLLGQLKKTAYVR